MQITNEGRISVKKICVYIMVFVMILSLEPIYTWAETSEITSNVYTTEDGVYEYTIDDNNFVTICKYNGNDTSVVIPDEIDGKKVVCLGDKAFYWNLEITDIKIPEGVTSIGNEAFWECLKLENITVPNSIKKIG